MTDKPLWLEENSLQQFFVATRQKGGEARVVGGAVRNYLMGEDNSDIDIASNLLPQQTIEIAKAFGWKAIPTGIAHGTVTLVVPERIIEVTTLRRDVATDGRHAHVAYTNQFEEDAARRDFTINALYMDAVGTVTDFFGGKTDLAARCVRFIGDPETRIAEDALRMLRFFRFLASYGMPPADEAALAAIAQKKAMIEQLSGERIAMEMKKLLQAVRPAYALRTMRETGADLFIFPRAIDPSRMIRLQLLETQADYQTSPWARIMALLGAKAEEAAWIAQRWKISRHEAKQLKQMVELPTFEANAPRHAHTRLLRLHGAPVYMDWLLVQAARQTGIDIAPYITLAHSFVAPIFPVQANDLLAKGFHEGKGLGEALAKLERKWEESDYRLTKDELLRQ